MKTFWISLAQPGTGGRVVLVDAESVHLANLKIHRLGLYKKGDESYTIELPPEAVEHGLPRDRVCTAEELRSVGARTIGEVSEQMQAIAADVGVFDADKTN